MPSPPSATGTVLTLQPVKCFSNAAFIQSQSSAELALPLERIGYNNYVAYHLALPSICLAYDYIWGVAGLSTKYLIIKACGGIMKENKCLHYS